MRFHVYYTIEGKIEVEGESMEEVLNNFDDGVGFSNDDLYENLTHVFNAYKVEKIKEGDE